MTRSVCAACDDGAARAIHGLTAGWPWGVLACPSRDQVIMILKQNYRQVSFLHVYHHVTIFGIWWLVTFTAPGGEGTHTAMQSGHGPLPLPLPLAFRS